MEPTSGMIGVIYNIAKDLSRASSHIFQIDENYSRECLEKYLSQLAEEVRITQFFGMDKFKSIDDSTIKLTIADKPRRFTAHNARRNVLTEDELITSGRPTVILGDPGSGKTTTAKRIAKYILTNPPADKADNFDFPLLIRARDLNQGKTLFETVSDIFGIPYDLEKLARIEPASEKNQEKENERELKEIRAAKAKLQTELLRALQVVMTSSNVCVMIDGIDEVTSIDDVDLLYHQLHLLRNSISGGNILATCRSGDFARTLEGFDVVEIAPLSEKEITAIVERWSSAPEEFIAMAGRTPYMALLDRPLFLCHVILLYEERKELPDRPSDVYRLVFLLMMEKWDRSRSVKRSKMSSYGKMKPERKIEVLSAVAIILLFDYDKSIFSEIDLENAYSIASENYGLRTSDAVQAVAEIESHTGIIVRSSYDKYEFSHYSLQEYLCADYIVRQPSLDFALSHFEKYNQPAAIAVCLSSNSSAYFSELILRLTTEYSLPIPKTMTSFLYRISLEAPYFVENDALGVALLTLANCTISRENPYFGNGEECLAGWLKFIKSLQNQKAIRKSIASAVQRFSVSGVNSNIIELSCPARSKLYPAKLTLPVEFRNFFFDVT